MKPRSGAVKNIEEQMKQTQQATGEMGTEILVENELDDFLPLNKEGCHERASDYIDDLREKLSEEELDRMYERTGQLDEHLFASAEERGAFSPTFVDRARLTLSVEYTKMADDDIEGFIMISFLEALYIMYGQLNDKASTNELFQEILPEAFRVMKNPQILETLYSFPSRFQVSRK